MTSLTQDESPRWCQMRLRPEPEGIRAIVSPLPKYASDSVHTEQNRYNSLYSYVSISVGIYAAGPTHLWPLPNPFMDSLCQIPWHTPRLYHKFVEQLYVLFPFDPATPTVVGLEEGTK